MSEGVEFDTDTQSIRRPGGPAASFGQSSSGSSGIAGWLMRRGWAKSPAAAQGIMIGVVVADIIIIFVLVKFFL